MFILHVLVGHRYLLAGASLPWSLSLAFGKFIIKFESSYIASSRIIHTVTLTVAYMRGVTSNADGVGAIPMLGC